MRTCIPDIQNSKIVTTIRGCSQKCVGGEGGGGKVMMRGGKKGGV